MTLFGILFVAINVMQIALLDHFNSMIWINVVPALVFVVEFITLALYLVHDSRWKAVREAWQKEHCKHSSQPSIPSSCARRPKLKDEYV